MPCRLAPVSTPEVSGPNQLFYQKFEALAVIGLVAMVPMIIASQGSVTLVLTCSHRWEPFEVREVRNDGQELVIGDVESSELRGSFLFSDCPSGRFWPLP